MKVAEFLLARLDEQQQDAGVTAQRRVVEWAKFQNEIGDDCDEEFVLMLLAEQFCGHPEFDPAWLPPSGD